MRRDNAPIGNTCPDIDAAIEVLAGVADRLESIASSLEDTSIAEDLDAQASNLRQLFEGKRSSLEELRNANDLLRQWGNKETERANDAETEVKSLRADLREMEEYR
jgi:hypothetical protein